MGGDKHYLCNNIPKALSEGNYKNARLDKDAFEEQLEKFPTGDMSDDEWVRCWHKLSFLRKGEKVFPPIQMCYRSTLVIPMSLLTKNLRQEFIEHFKVDSDAERIVFGFLCFDHPEAGFFEDSDVHFGYIVADFLSLYLIQQLLYTDYSSVYQLAHTAIAEYRK